MEPVTVMPGLPPQLSPTPTPTPAFTAMSRPGVLPSPWAPYASPHSAGSNSMARNAMPTAVSPSCLFQINGAMSPLGQERVVSVDGSGESRGSSGWSIFLGILLLLFFIWLIMAVVNSAVQRQSVQLDPRRNFSGLYAWLMRNQRRASSQNRGGRSSPSSGSRGYYASRGTARGTRPVSGRPLAGPGGPGAQGPTTGRATALASASSSGGSPSRMVGTSTRTGPVLLPGSNGVSRPVIGTGPGNGETASYRQADMAWLPSNNVNFANPWSGARTDTRQAFTSQGTIPATSAVEYSRVPATTRTGGDMASVTSGLTMSAMSPTGGTHPCDGVPNPCPTSQKCLRTSDTGYVCVTRPATVDTSSVRLDDPSVTHAANMDAQMMYPYA